MKGKSRPINTFQSRIKLLESVRYIDFIICFDENTQIKIIKKIKPHILIKGGDYSKKEIVGNKFVRSYGGKVILSKFIKNFSSSKIINKLIK